MGTHRPSPATTTLESNSFRAACIEGVVIVRWFSETKPEEFPPLTKFVVDAASTSGGKVDLIAIVPPLNAVPPAGLPDAMGDFATATRDILETTHIILAGGSGFWQTIVRSLVTSLMIIVRKHGQVLTHDSIDGALARLHATRGLDAAAWRTSAEAHGVLDQDAAASGRFEKQVSAKASGGRG